MKSSLLPKLSSIALGVGLLLGQRLQVAAADSVVTFRLDMTYVSTNGWFIPGSSSVFARGSFNNWSTGSYYDGSGSSELTNDPTATGLASNIYTGTFHDTNDANGSTLNFKYYISTATRWEDDINNRTGSLPANSGDSLVLPLVYFDDKAPATNNAVTNDVTFQVDMGAQTLAGKFTPGTSIVYGRGSFEGWGLDFPLTNNPAGPNTNVYSGVYTISDQPHASVAYKFYIDTGSNWENPVSTGGNNRTFNLLGANGPEVLPLVPFNDVALSDLLPFDSMVTFSINMTNAVGTDSHVFDPAADSVYINGDFIGWWSWGPVSPPDQYRLTNNPVGSEIYTLTLPVPKGNSLGLTYKFSINGPDNEAGFAINHVRFIRQTTNYTMPPDKFANSFNEPLLTSGKSFGELKVIPSTAGHVEVSWLGLPGVHLQSTPSVTPPVVWTDLTQTDGTNWTTGTLSNDGFISKTNYTSSGSRTFFRLVQPKQ